MMYSPETAALIKALRQHIIKLENVLEETQAQLAYREMQLEELRGSAVYADNNVWNEIYKEGK